MCEISRQKSVFYFYRNISQNVSVSDHKQKKNRPPPSPNKSSLGTADEERKDPRLVGG